MLEILLETPFARLLRFVNASILPQRPSKNIRRASDGCRVVFVEFFMVLVFPMGSDSPKPLLCIVYFDDET